MTQEEKAMAYDEALKRVKEINNEHKAQPFDVMLKVFPELKESNDERIMRFIISGMTALKEQGKETFATIPINDCIAWLEKQGESYTKKDVDDAYVEGMVFAKDELERQGNSFIKWNKNTKDNKPPFNHSVLMKTTHGIAEGEWKGEYWYQYRWSSSVNDSDVLSWMELSDLEKQDRHRRTKLPEENDIDEEYKIGKWFTGLIPCWINAPSTLQSEHSNHGKNVVAIHLKEGGYRCCCIDDKKPRVFNVAENTPFVEGWHNRESSEWSEEDERKYEDIRGYIYHCCVPTEAKHLCNWLETQLSK